MCVKSLSSRETRWFVDIPETTAKSIKQMKEQVSCGFSTPDHFKPLPVCNLFSPHLRQWLSTHGWSSYQRERRTISRSLDGCWCERWIVITGYITLSNGSKTTNSRTRNVNTASDFCLWSTLRGTCRRSRAIVELLFTSEQVNQGDVPRLRCTM